jgi:hypothetical protein
MSAGVGAQVVPQRRAQPGSALRTQDAAEQRGTPSGGARPVDRPHKRQALQMLPVASHSAVPAPAPAHAQSGTQLQSTVTTIAMVL